MTGTPTPPGDGNDVWVTPPPEDTPDHSSPPAAGASTRAGRIKTVAFVAAGVLVGGGVVTAVTPATRPPRPGTTVRAPVTASPGRRPDRAVPRAA
jgi:hypothetical protein